MAANFVWGANGRQITNPEQAARQRAVAEALMLQGTSPATNWGEGLADVTGALSGALLNNEVLAAERAGAEVAGGLFGGLSSASSQADIIAALNSPWLNENQSSVAKSLLGEQLKAEGPDVTAPSSVREWEYFNTLPPEQQTQYLIMKRANPYMNTGTEFVQADPVNPGEVLGEAIPINNEQKAFDEAFGSSAGKAAAERIEQLPGLIAKADNMVTTIDGVLNDPALDSSTGWLQWMQLIPGSDGYRFGQRALQLQGQSFLQAFESLRGGGAITQIEGEKATAAIGRLSTAQKPEDYRDALNELKGIIEASKQRAIQRSGGGAAPAANPSAVVVDGFTIEAVD